MFQKLDVSGLTTLAGTHMSHDAALQEKMLCHSLLEEFVWYLLVLGTHREFQNELTISTEVPLCFKQ